MPDNKQFVNVNNLGTFFENVVQDWVEDQTVDVTWAQYQALPQTEKMSGKTFHITDKSSSSLNDIPWSQVTDKPSWVDSDTKPTYTASEVGLGNVGNFKAVSTEANQDLTSTEQANARTNIGAGTSSFDGAYSSLTGTPTLGTASSKDVASSGDASVSQVVMGNDSRLSDARDAADVYSWAKAATKPSYTASEVGAIDSTTKGVANGVAELDANGLVPSSQLPSYVDDILEYNSASVFPITGETGKIYVDTSTNLTYRWGGTSYVEISASLALGDTSSTAYRGDHGLAAYNHSQLTSGNPHNVTAADVGLGSPLTGAIMATSPTSTTIYSVSPAEMRKIIKQVLLGGDGTTDFTSEELANLRGMSSNSQALSNITIETSS